MNLSRTCIAASAIVFVGPALIGVVDALSWFYASQQFTGMEWGPERGFIAVGGAIVGLFLGGIAVDPRLWSK